MGPLGWQETVFIFLLALLLFGPKKLPELGRTIGKAITEFKRASNELKATFDKELSSLEREDQSIKEVTSSYDPSNYSYNYDYSYDSYSGGSTTSSSEASTATEPSTVSASATQGAESSNGTAPEGTVATTVSGNGTAQAASDAVSPDKPADGPQSVAS
ncbi:MAG TPA: twin-arginine translocase TatA/TatE family subunit [Bryobacteraceae bacterium]